MKLDYSSQIYPSLLYCSAIWGGAYQTYVQSLFFAQKKKKKKYYVLWFIVTLTSTPNPTFHITKYVLKMHIILSLQTSLFVYYSQTTNSVDSEFESIVHTGMRRPHLLRLPQCCTSHAQQSVLVRDARLWNHLPDKLRLCYTKHNLKWKLKRILLDKYDE